MCCTWSILAQENADSLPLQFQDTIYLNESGLEESVIYSATDSIYADLKNEKIRLYRDAKVIYGTTIMEAGFIELDLKKNELLATYLTDSLGNKIGVPKFTENGEEISASSIRYNFDSQKGYIKDVQIQQDEIYLYMGTAKRQANEEIHFVKGRFTTCDLEEPHFHFQLSKGVMIPKKRIVSGPMNLWVNGVPTPLGLPFIVLPQKQEERLTGFIFPQVVPSSPYGFGFQDLGYYLPINDNIQTSFFGTLYSRGSFGIKNQTDYYKRYSYSGSLQLGFDIFRTGFPTNTSKRNYKVQWMHRKDPKSNPYWNFTSNVNFNSINNPQFNLDPTNQQYLSNSFNSDIRLERSFGSLPIRSGIKMSTRQNTVNESIELLSPVFNLNMTQIFPLKNLVKSSRGWRQLFTRFGVTYDFEGKNSSLFADTLLNQGNFNEIGNTFKNGINQKVIMKTTAGLFKNTWKVTPSLNYGTTYNFQTSERYYDSLGSIQTRLLNQSGLGQSMSLNANVTTVLYSYYRFVGPKKSLLRHVMTPSFGYRFIPNLNPVSLLNNSSGTDIEYSPFERSIYSVSATRDQSLFTFGLNNTFELKRASEKDTVTGFKKTMLIDQLSLTGNYDFLKDSMNLSDMSLSMRISPLKALSIVANGSFSPYAWNDSTGRSTPQYAIDSLGTLGRFKSATLNTNFVITSKSSREKLKTNKEDVQKDWNYDMNYYMLHPEYIVDFDIPWKLNIAHVYQVRVNESRTTSNNQVYTPLQTLNFNGDLSFTKRWKLSGNSSFDFETSRITYTQLNLVRDLHCWTFTFNWTPISQYKFFSFQMNAKSSLFQDAKIRIQKPPFFL
jgi:hypothetical protein